ncbi:MAG: WD40 repeat domain-containing protein [Armatimonadota bacterium]
MRAMMTVLEAAAIAACALTMAGGAQDRLGDALPEGAVQRLGTLRMRYAGGIGDLCYLPDGRAVIAVGNRLEIWDLAAGELQSNHEVCDSAIRGVEPRSDGSMLLVADSGGGVHEWSLADRRLVRSIATGQAGLVAAHYSPDERRVLTTGSRPPTLKQWDLASGEELIAIEGRMHYFREGIYGPEGRTAIADGGAGSGEILEHWDLRTGELLKAWLKDYYAHSRSMELSADGERLLVGSRHSAQEWLLESCEMLGKFSGHHGHAVTAVAYCTDPGELLTGSRDGSIRRWNRHDEEVLLRWVPHDGHVTRIEVSPDGRWVLSYGSRLVAETRVEDGTPRVVWERHNGPVQAVDALGSGMAVSGSTDETLRVWDLASGECLRTITGATLGAYAVAVSPDGSRVAAGCKDGVLREFDLADGALLRELTGHRGYVRAVAYTPRGTHLLSTAGDGTVRAWGRERAEPVLVLDEHRGGALAVGVSPDGNAALSGGRDGTVRYWDLQRGELVRTMTGHRGWVQAVAFLGQEQALSGARDGRILRWDLASGEMAGEMVHGHAVHALAVTEDGRVLAGGGDLITCWDLSTGEQTAILSGHAASVLDLALTPDERHLLSASQDTTLLVWPVP